MQHYAEPDRQQKGGGKRKTMRQRKQNEEDASTTAGECDPSSEAAHATAGCKCERAKQSADTSCTHKDSQAACAAVQNFVSEDRHQHGVRHRDQTYQSQKQQQRANRRSLAGKTESLDDMS